MNQRLRLIIIALVLIFFLLFLGFLFGGNNGNDENNIAQCPAALQQCGQGCIPQNATCCDDGVTNQYCLGPTHGCGTENCGYQCPAGQAFCGMFCRPIGEQCCFGGVCPTANNNGNDNGGDEPKIPEEKINITFESAKNIVCAFEKSDLWSPQMAWDGSYICRGSLTFDLHGATFPEDRTLRFDIDPRPDYADFGEYEAAANTPINKITIQYSDVGGDYFQSNKPQCPAKNLAGKVRMFEAVPDVERPFPTQYFNVNIPASCE